MGVFFNYWLTALRFGFDAQQVASTRLARFAISDARGAPEAILMVTEKIAALGEAQVAMVLAMTTGASAETAMRAAFAPYRRRVTANRKRLCN